MPRIELAGRNAQDAEAKTANTGRLLNTYRAPAVGTNRHILRPVPGRRLVADTGGAFLRRMEWIDGKVYAANSGKLYFIAGTGAVTDLGSIEDDENTAISGNSGDVTLVSGGRYYVYDGTSISQPGGGAFTDFGSVESLGQYTLLTERGGRRIQWSDLADAKTLDALNFATTETRDDNNIRGVVVGGLYWVFKERSVEIWQSTGLGGVDAFQRVPSGLIDKGLKGFNLVCKARDAIFFIGSDNVAYITTGGQPQRVSDTAVETNISGGTATHCQYYEQLGHKFCVIRYTDRPADVIDLATGETHRRSVGRLHDAWNGIDVVEAEGGVFWAGTLDGKISELIDEAVDLDGPLFQRIQSPSLRVQNSPFRVRELELFGAYGYEPTRDERLDLLSLGGVFVLDIGEAALEVGRDPGNEANLMISFSGDGGASYGKERFVRLGLQGDYNHRTVLRALGQFRRITMRIDISHGFNIPIYSDSWLEVA